MLPLLPKLISNKAIEIYFVSLALVSLVFMKYVMDFKFILLGALFVLSFFSYSQQLSLSWSNVSSGGFVKKLFWTAFLIRAIWVFFSYYFYQANTGLPFEWGAADSRGYHGEAEWLSGEEWDVAWQYWDIGHKGVSDVGYPLYLTVVYRIFGPDLIVARLIKAVLGAVTCVLIYKLSSRTFGDGIGRIAGLFGMLMPNLIIYCGLHTKETEMVFCVMMFLERADYLLRSKHYSLKTIVVPSFFAFSLFFFRTVLGVVAFFSFFTALFFNSEKTIRKGKKIILAIWMVSALAVFAGGTILTEVEGYWNSRVSNEIAKREYQSSTAKWAKYATGTVMAPMIFALPFSTMVNTGQQNQNVVHGGNYVKNFLCVFVVFALFYSIKDKKWREYSFIGSFAVFYLGVISFSGYANAERFHMPALPCILMMAACGVSRLNAKNYRFVNYWCYVVVLMEFAWAFFKLGSRGVVGF